jgi:thioredoxin 1
MEKITSQEFEEKISSNEFVIVDFSSPGCAPCQKVPSLLKDVVDELPDIRISTFELDVTEEPDIARKYFILGVPTIIIFNQSKEIKRFVSLPKKEKLKEAIIK